MVLFDASMLSLLLHPGAKTVTDPKGKPITDAQSRVEYLVDGLDKGKTKILIPTPALAEFLVLVGPAGPQYLEKINDRTCFKIVGFGERAAVEVAIQLRKALNLGNKKSGSTGTWAKVKFDRQIVAIAKVEGVTIIYSDDEDVARFAKVENIDVRGIKDLPLPPVEAQQKLKLDEQTTITSNVKS